MDELIELRIAYTEFCLKYNELMQFPNICRTTQQHNELEDKYNEFFKKLYDIQSSNDEAERLTIDIFNKCLIYQTTTGQTLVLIDALQHIAFERITKKARNTI